MYPDPNWGICFHPILATVSSVCVKWNYQLSLSDFLKSLHSRVLGHSRSLPLLPFDRPYTISYYRVRQNKVAP